MNELGLLTHAAQQFTKTFDILKEQKGAKQYDEYASILSSAESFEAARPPEGADTRVWNQAVVDHIGKEIAVGQMKEQRVALLKAEMGAKREMILNNAREAEALVPTSSEQALAKYMESYSAHPNGVTVRKNEETGQWDFENTMSGGKWSAAVTLDDARQMTQAMLGPGEYEKIYLGDRSRVINFNKVSMLNPDIMENSKGEQISVFTLLDPNTGSKVLKVLTPSGTMEELNPEDVLHGGYKMLKDSREERMSELGFKKKEQDIQRGDQVMRHAEETMGLRREAAKQQTVGGGGRGMTKPTHKEEIMNAYNIDDAAAMDLIRSDKTLPQRLSMAKDQIKESMLDPQDPKDAEKIMQILKQFKVDKLPGHEGYGREKEEPDVRRGLQDDPADVVPPDDNMETKGGQQNIIIDKLKNLFPDAPDGTIKRHKSGGRYIKTQGQWKLIEG